MQAHTAERYLSHKLPAAKHLTVLSVSQVYPGMSRQTWLTEAEWEEGGGKRREGFVFRMDHPSGSQVPIPLGYEFEIYDHLKGSNIPVAETLWYERDPQWLIDGREFYVRKMLPGSTSIPGLGDPAYREMHIAMAKEHAEKMALVHTLDWKRQGFGELEQKFPECWITPDETRCNRADLDIWEKRFRRFEQDCYPDMVYVLTWLKDHVPARSPRISLVKGNNGMDEEIWDGTKIVGLSDWELTHLGDPTEDWAWASMQGIGHLWDLRNILAHYEAKSGVTIERQSLEYFDVLVRFKSYVSTLCAAKSFIEGRDLRAPVAALSFLGNVLRMDMVRRVNNMARASFSLQGN